MYVQRWLKVRFHKLRGLSHRIILQHMGIIVFSSYCISFLFFVRTRCDYEQSFKKSSWNRNQNLCFIFKLIPTNVVEHTAYVSDATPSVTVFWTWNNINIKFLFQPCVQTSKLINCLLLSSYQVFYYLKYFYLFLACYFKYIFIKIEKKITCFVSEYEITFNNMDYQGLWRSFKR